LIFTAGRLRTGRKQEFSGVLLDRFLNGTDMRRGRFRAATRTVNRRRCSFRRRRSSGGMPPHLRGEPGLFRGGLFGTRHGARQRCAE
jgi:hypothetical protein